MSRFLRREKAYGSPIYQAILEEAGRRLEHVGCFEKWDIIEKLNFDAIEDAIRWDYIREFLQERTGCELVPLSASFFKRHKFQEEIANPGKFIAVGHGQKTAGYATVSARNDHLVIERVKERKAMRNGVAQKFQDYINAVARKRTELGLTSEEKLLPPAA